MTEDPAKPTRSGKDWLRPRARIIRAIGEDLISSEIIALVELIKNAYDADAHHVHIQFESPLRREAGAIVVTDDGHGMALDTFKAAWLEPATISKRKTRASPGGRRVTGEKGLGRFAAARLAESMRVESVAAGSGTRVVAGLEWGAFRDEERFLDEVQCEWEEYRADPATPSGTSLRLARLRDDWSEPSFRRLRAELARLVARPRPGEAFVIELDLPSAFKELAGPITPPPVLGKPNYTMDGSVSAEGHIVAKGKLSEQEVGVDQVIRLEGGRTPRCGAFEFELRVWDRDPDTLGALALTLKSTLRDLRRDLDEACGVSIYRDSFRVLPYGGPANDWLRLDLRRVQNPTMRLSNNQIVGSIYITADGNSELRDQTNREGLVDSQAFTDLRACVIEVLAQLEGLRYRSRHPRRKEGERSPLFAALDFEPVRDSFKRRYPEDTEFLAYLEERARQFKSSVEQVQQVLARYRRLATLGQLIDVVLHDGRTPVTAIANECELARREIKREKDDERLRQNVATRFDTIETQTEVLSSLFRRIAPFGGRKRGRPSEQALEQIIADAFAIYRNRIDDLGIKVVLPEGNTPVTVDTSEMQQIIVNLLDNAMYWLEKVPQTTRAINVGVRKVDGAVEILLADSGPGIPDEARDYIFDPYFSTKPDGVGLGLTIAGETAAEYDGTLELVSAGLLPGATFRVTLRRRVGEGGP